MKLAGYIGDGGAVKDVQDLRDLSVEELKQHALFKPVVAEATSRLALFRVLDENHREWSDYIKTLLHPNAVDNGAVVLELERLLLNYLACAQHIRAHFEASFQQRFRTDSAEQKKYKMLLENLVQTSWAFAFFLDFRNYLQHQGLGLGFYNRKISATSVSLEITLNSVELLNTTKDWPRSKLAAPKGILELTGLLRDFHAQMMQNYSGIVVKTLFADLIPGADFYKKLTDETQKIKPGATMAFSNGDAAKLVFAPNDLFAELGLPAVKK